MKKLILCLLLIPYFNLNVGGSITKDHTELCGEEADICCNPMFTTEGKYSQIYCMVNIKKYSQKGLDNGSISSNKWITAL